MDSTAGLRAFCRISFALAGVTMLVGLAGCGGMGESRANGATPDAALPPIWPAEVTVNSCEDFASVGVGSYVISSNYWNKAVCPGTQCVEINTATGAFSVTQGPPACGDYVASFPNVLYGCSYGNCDRRSLSLSSTRHGSNPHARHLSLRFFKTGQVVIPELARKL